MDPPGLDRATLFENEKFTFATLQAVAGGSMVAALSQLEAIKLLAGKWPTVIFLTAQACALVIALLGVFFRHQYKKWDVKQAALAWQFQDTNPLSKPITPEGKRGISKRYNRAKNYLSAMRACMCASVLLVAAAFIELIAAFWFPDIGQYLKN